MLWNALECSECLPSLTDGVPHVPQHSASLESCGTPPQLTDGLSRYVHSGPGQGTTLPGHGPGYNPFSLLSSWFVKPLRAQIPRLSELTVLPGPLLGVVSLVLSIASPRVWVIQTNSPS